MRQHWAFLEGWQWGFVYDGNGLFQYWQFAKFVSAHTAEQKRAVSSSYRYTGTEYGIPVLMISESLISLSELIMHFITLTVTNRTEHNLGTALDQHITIELTTHAW